MSTVSLPKCHLLNKFGHEATRQGWTVATDKPRAEHEEPSPAFILADHPTLGFHADTAVLDGFADGQLVLTPVKLVSDADGHTRWVVQPGQRQAFSTPALAIAFMGLNLKERLTETANAHTAAMARLFQEGFEYRQDMFTYGRH